MKTILVLLSLLSFSAFSANIKDTVAGVENKNEVTCIRTKVSTKLCLMYTCRYKVTFTCEGESGMYDLKLTVIEDYAKQRVKNVVFKAK